MYRQNPFLNVRVYILQRTEKHLKAATIKGKRATVHLVNLHERYEIVVLLPNSEHIKGNIMKYQLRDADARTVHLRGKTFINNDGYEYDLVTLNFVVCGQKHKVFLKKLVFLVRISRTI